MTYTKGPWFVEEGHIQRDSGGIRYWQVTDGQDAICCNQFCYAENSPANARLISAAPELLGACEALLERYRIMVAADGPECLQAIAAIAKARGTGGV